MDYQKKAEEVWRELHEVYIAHEDMREVLKTLATALEQADKGAFKRGVEAMRDAAITDNYEEMDLDKRLGELADSLLSKSEEVKK